MSPDYFLYHLTLSEATDYIKGQDRRHRQQWEMTRLLAVGLGAEGFELPWEKEELHAKSEEEMSEEEKEWEALRRKAEAINNRNKK